MKWLSKIKIKYLWILFAISIIVCAVTVYLCTFIEQKNLSMVILVIVFLLMGTIFEIALSRTMMKKALKINYVSINNTFVGLEKAKEILKEKGFNSHKFTYGLSFTKIIDKTVYKVIFIEDSKAYESMNPEDSNSPKTKGIEKCERFVGFELFFNTHDTVREKVKDFSFHGDKVLYEGFYYENDILVEPNYINPTDDFKDDYLFLKGLLEIQEIK